MSMIDLRVGEKTEKEKMKCLNDSGNGSENRSNWLGFSLSPHIKMGVTSTATDAVSGAPASFFLPSSHLQTSAIGCYGVGQNGSFHAPLSVMPLKSDGSLCIMEALTRSQPEGFVPNSSPKLEDFLGGASMETSQYGGQEREGMALSLDSMYYNNQNAESGTDRRSSLDLLHESFKRQQHENHFPVQTQLYYSGICSQPIYDRQHPQEHAKETNFQDSDAQITDWVTRHFPVHQVQLDQNLNTDHIVDENGGSGSGNMNCGELQSLSLSMSPGSQSSCISGARQISPTAGAECVAVETKKRGSGKAGQKQPVHRKSLDTFGQRTSQYRGVTRHRWTGRYEAHLWDNSCKKEGQTRKGRQVYLGGYDMEDKAARAYDLAALKYWGPSTHINFPIENYRDQLEEMKNMTRQEYVAHLRRKSSGFSRGASMYRGVTRHHQHGRWQARIGRVAGNKDLYLGTFSAQEEAAEAYDVAAIKFRGANAVTNFDITRYDVKRIMESNTLLAGELARRTKDTEVNHHGTVNNVPQMQGNGEVVHSESNNRNGTEWQMVSYESPDEQHLSAESQSIESLDQKNLPCAASYADDSFSIAQQSLLQIDHSHNSSQPMVYPSSELSVTNFSNPSSLATSLSSSREDSPERAALGMLFAKSPLASKFIRPATGLSTWFPAAASISFSHLPVFAAWNDA